MKKANWLLLLALAGMAVAAALAGLSLKQESVALFDRYILLFGACAAGAAIILWVGSKNAGRTS